MDHDLLFRDDLSGVFNEQHQDVERPAANGHPLPGV